MDTGQVKILLRITEAAALVGLGRSTIYSLISSGTLPVVRVGRAVRIPALALHEWAANAAATKKPATCHAAGAGDEHFKPPAAGGINGGTDQ
jgi:excisionase family DNA binding protein